MATLIRPELSTKNKYWIDKHRYYELKHFCLQYPEWKKTYIYLGDAAIPSTALEQIRSNNLPSNPTERRAIIRARYYEKINLIEKTAINTDKHLCNYILKAVTEELSYMYLKSKLNIPCCKDTYYDRYRRFFWLLNTERD